MPGTPFRLHVDQVGGRLTVDGVDIPDDQVLATEVIMAKGQPTRLIVHVSAEGAITGSGIVETIRDAPSGDQVRRLNPEAIRAAVTPRLTMGTSAAGVYRDVIAEMLDQAAQA